MRIDYIPIYKNEMIPTEDNFYHTKGEIPPGITNVENFRNRMIEEALHSDYLSDCDYVIIIEKGKVIKIVDNKM